VIIDWWVKSESIGKPIDMSGGKRSKKPDEFNDFLIVKMRGTPMGTFF